MTDPVVIDGAVGGGQMLRSAVALSAVRGRPVRVENIRGARPKPGLRPQHLLALNAVARACSAELAGAEIGSRDIEFRPGQIVPQTDQRLDVGTAGSVTLILQCLLPALAAAPAGSRSTLVGGTDVPFAPPFDYFAHVFVPALAALGPRVNSTLGRRGFYPKGGGEIEVVVEPSGAIEPFTWGHRRPVVHVRGRSYSQGLPGHIVSRMRKAALAVLDAAGYSSAEIAEEIAQRGPSEGCGIVLWAECEGGGRLGASALGRRGTRAEQVGEEAARALVAELHPSGAVDSHLADQMIVWMALAEAPCELTTSRLTDHIRAAANVAGAIAGARFSFDEGPPARVRCEPAPGGFGKG